MPVESPCVRHCCLDEQDICLGCGRSLVEITSWAAASDQRRQEIILFAAERLAKKNSALNTHPGAKNDHRH